MAKIICSRSVGCLSGSGSSGHSILTLWIGSLSSTSMILTLATGGRCLLATGASPNPRDVGARCWEARAVARPRLHQLPALREKITAAIGALDIVANAMCKCEFGGLAREGGLLGDPITEGATEAVHGGGIGQRSQVFPDRMAANCGEDRPLATLARRLFQHGARGPRQGHPVLAAGLHALRWHDPGPAVTLGLVDLVPGGADDLTGPRRGQDEVFERARVDIVALA